MIIYFTGTGNSRDIATRISMLLNDDDIVELCNETLRSGVISAKHTCKKVVWVFPVYSWGVPPVVAKFIKQAKVSGIEGAEHHMVATCGDDAGLIAKQWRKLISGKGWKAASASTIVMPNTYTLMKGFDVDSKELEQHKLSNAPIRIREIAHKIKIGDNSDDVERGNWAWVKTAIIHPFFKHFCISPRQFRINNKCISCGKCANACPLNNIKISNNTPRWNNNCALCLRCYHICPTQAIEYGNATKGKGQYNTLMHNY